MNQSIALAQCLVSIGIIGYIWAGPFAQYRRDNFRSRIRRIRDSLFDFMCQNGYDFNDPAYRATRQSLNGTLRLSNYFSPLSFCVALVAAIRIGTRNVETTEAAIAQLPDGVLKNRLMDSLGAARKEVMCFIFLKSIPGLLTSLTMLSLCIAVVAWQKGTATAEALFRKSTSMLLEDAYLFGVPNLPRTMRHIVARQT